MKERIAPCWQPNERECLAAILEPLIDEGVVATRRKLGLSALALVDTDFWINVGMDCDRLLQSPELVQMLVDFLPYFWLADQDAWTGLTLPEEHSNTVLRELLKNLALQWNHAGTLMLVDTITPQAAHLIRAHQQQIHRVITLVGPSLNYACTTWGLRPEQYKTLISRDTLEALDPHIRWNMIYGSQML